MRVQTLSICLVLLLVSSLALLPIYGHANELVDQFIQTGYVVAIDARNDALKTMLETEEFSTPRAGCLGRLCGAPSYTVVKVYKAREEILLQMQNNFNKDTSHVILDPIVLKGNIVALVNNWNPKWKKTKRQRQSDKTCVSTDPVTFLSDSKTGLVTGDQLSSFLSNFKESKAQKAGIVYDGFFDSTIVQEILTPSKQVFAAYSNLARKKKMKMTPPISRKISWGEDEQKNDGVGNSASSIAPEDSISDPSKKL